MTAERSGWRRLGAVLVEAGLLREDDLEKALDEKERSDELLGTILVRRGLVSAAAVANALAEQYGSFLKSEHGFGTGLRDTRAQGDIRDRRATEPEAPPVSMTELRTQAAKVRSGATPEASASTDEPALDHEGPKLAGTHLLFVPTQQGYLLLERDGAAPSLGEKVDLAETAAKQLVVVKVTSSPLPADPRVCAYLQEL
jgi:hypothetical protein